MNILEKLGSYLHGLRILSEWGIAGGKVVERSIAQARANICETCNRNDSGWEIPETAANAIKEQMALRHHLDLNLPNDTSLHTCGVCHCPIKLKLWIPIEQLLKYETQDSLAAFPEHCWLRKGI